MAWPVVVASNGFGIPVTESDNEFATPIEIAANGLGTPVVFVEANGLPVKGWSPLALGASLLAWWTADRADLITLNSTAVTSWKDVVAGYDAGQALSAARPLYSATSFNGAPGVTFDGIDDELTLASVPFPTGANGVGLAAVAQQDALASGASIRALLSYGGGGSTNVQRALRRNVVTAVNRGVVSTGDGAIAQSVTEGTVDLTGRHTWRSAISATSTSLLIDGVAATPLAVVPATGTNRTRIGANATDAAGQFWSGPVRDIVVYDLGASVDQIAALDAWLASQRNE